MEIDRELFLAAASARRLDSSLVLLLHCNYFNVLGFLEVLSENFAKVQPIFDSCKFFGNFLFILTNPAEPSDNFKRFNLSAPPLRGVLLKSECKGRHFTRNLQIFPTILTQI